MVKGGLIVIACHSSDLSEGEFPAPLPSLPSAKAVMSVSQNIVQK